MLGPPIALFRLLARRPDRARRARMGSLLPVPPVSADAAQRELIIDRTTALCWTDPGDRAVLHAVDALHARSDLTDGEWDALVAAAGEEGTIDLMLLCGWYHAISYLARAARLAPEPGAATTVRPAERE